MNLAGDWFALPDDNAADPKTDHKELAAIPRKPLQLKDGVSEVKHSG